MPPFRTVDAALAGRATGERLSTPISFNVHLEWGDPSTSIGRPPFEFDVEAETENEAASIAEELWPGYVAYDIAGVNE